MNTVLNFYPRPEHDVPWENRVYMVWPGFAWRVVAPLPNDRRINILQKAVLSFCRCGSFTASEIAASLQLHPHLVDFIGQELVGFGWIDSTTWLPTPQGLAALREEELTMDSLVTGWVFQNTLTQELWPFFSPQLQLQDVTTDSSPSSLLLLLETKRCVRKVPAWDVGAFSGASQPSAQAILTAIRRSRRRKKLRGYMQLAQSDFPEFAIEGSPEYLSRISLVGDQPEPVGFVTYGYYPNDCSLLPQVCDPFGFGCSEDIWRHLQRFAEQDEGATRARDQLLRLADAQNGPALQEQLAHQQQLAEAEVIARLSLDIKTVPAVFEHLTAAQSSLNMAEATNGTIQNHLAAVMNNCRKAFEALLKDIARHYPLTMAHTLIPKRSPGQNQETLKHITKTIGFSDPIPPRLPNTIAARGFDKSVEDICSDLEALFSLARGVVVILFSTKHYSNNHPLCTAASKDPDLLHKLIKLIDYGNEGSHDNSHEDIPKNLTLSEASEQFHRTLHVTSCLLDLPLNSTHS